MRYELEPVHYSAYTHTQTFSRNPASSPLQIRVQDSWSYSYYLHIKNIYSFHSSLGEI